MSLDFSKTWLPRILHPFKPKAFSDATISELEKLDVRASGRDGAFYFVELAQGKKFYAYEPTLLERRQFLSLPRSVRQKIRPEAIRAARLGATRYFYPHALPGLCAPYDQRARATLGKHHADVIDDLVQLNPSEREALKMKFTPKRGDTVLELGPYMGFGTLRLSELVGPEGRVLAVEADPTNRKLIQKNLDANRRTNVTLFANAAWNENTVLEFHMSDQDRQEQTLKPEVHLDSLRPGEATVLRVEAVRVDELLKGANVRNLSLVCVTVNGAELEALQGMEETLKSEKPTLSIAGFKKLDGVPISGKIADYLKSLGYRAEIGPRHRVYAWKP